MRKKSGAALRQLSGRTGGDILQGIGVSSAKKVGDEPGGWILEPQRTDLGEGVSSLLLYSPWLGWSQPALGRPRWGPDGQEGWEGAGDPMSTFDNTENSAWREAG